MDIKPTYVTFEQAKLLKEKGFKYYCPLSYWEQKLTNNTPGYALENGETSQENYYNFERYYAPEQWQVVEWLRIKHGIWVWVRPFKDHAADNNDPIQHQMNIFFKGVSISKEFDSHEEAYSAAFDYILKEMI